MVQIPGAGDPLSQLGPGQLRGDQDRATQPLTPAVIPIPALARDPGVKYSDRSPPYARGYEVQDPTGQAMQSFAKDMAAVGEQFNQLYEQQKGTEDALMAEEYKNQVTAESTRIVAEALSSPETGDPNIVHIVDSRITQRSQELKKQLVESTGYQPGRKGSIMLAQYEIQARTQAGAAIAGGAVKQREALAGVRANELVDKTVAFAVSLDDPEGGYAQVERDLAPLRAISDPAEFQKKLIEARARVYNGVATARGERGDHYGVSSMVDRARGYPASAVEYHGAESVIRLGVKDPRVFLELTRSYPLGDGVEDAAKTGTATGVMKFLSGSGRRYGVQDSPAQRGAVGNMEMSAHYYVELRDRLTQKLGREPTAGEMRLGWSGMEELVGEGTGGKAAAGLVSDDAAKTNQPLLTVKNSDGTERPATVAEVQARADAMMVGAQRDPANVISEKERHQQVVQMEAQRERHLKRSMESQTNNSDEAYKEIEDLRDKKLLTREILDYYKPRLKGAHFKAGLGLFEEQTRELNLSRVHQLVVGTTTMQPLEFQTMMHQAIVDRLIDAKEGFARIDQNIAAMKLGQPPNPYKTGHDLITTLTNPVGVNANMASLFSQQQAAAVLEYDAWFRTQPKDETGKPKAQHDHADTISNAHRIFKNHFKSALETHSVDLLPWSQYFPKDKIKTADDVTKEHIAEAKKKLAVDTFGTGKLNREQFFIEHDKLDKWSTAVELKKRAATTVFGTRVGK